MNKTCNEPHIWHNAGNCTNTGSCVQVAALSGGGAAIRDSKHPQGPELHFDAAEWSAFLAAAKAGEFDPHPTD